MVVDAHIMT